MEKTRCRECGGRFEMADDDVVCDFCWETSYVPAPTEVYGPHNSRARRVSRWHLNRGRWPVMEMR